MTILLLHTFSALALCGLIWFVQVVHYPLFADVGRERFSTYAQLHQRLTARVVGPLMLTEMATATVLAWAPPAGAAALARLGWIVLLVIWLSTFRLQVPLHRLLAAGFDERAAQRLVRTNWIRTVGWSTRAVLALYIVSLEATP